MNRLIIKHILFFTVLAMLPAAVSAQKDVRTNIRKGNKEYKQEKFTEAAKRYESAVEGNASSKEAIFNLGNTLYRQKEWDKAIEQFNHGISLEQEKPLDASAGWHNVGNAMLQKKELEKSLEAYKMALRLNPDDNETRYNLAVVQKMLQDQEQEGGGQDDQDNQQDQQQDQQDQQDQQQQDQPQDQQDKEKRAEEPNQPEQMSRDNARQILQAIEQDERETQEKVQKIKAQEREQQAEHNRRNNKNW